jgi:2'-5' RNA ligase
LPTTDSSYRIFVGAFPSGSLAESIQAVRLRWDPRTARITPPHVTLAGTYQRPGLPSPGGEAEIIARLSTLHQSVKPFELVMAGVRTFPPEDQPVIFLKIEPSASLLAARQALLELIGPDSHNHYIPHLTLAMRLQGESARKALNTLKNSDFASRRLIAPINELRLMQRGPVDPSWRCVATFSLTGNGKTGHCDEPTP